MKEKIKKTSACFIKSPYENGISVRDDVFRNQFTVTFYGEAKVKDESSMYGDFEILAAVPVAQAALISSAARLAEAISDNHVLTQVRSSIDNVVHFNGLYVKITDRFNRLVVGGKFVGKSIVWITPAYDLDTRQKITEQIELLYADANISAGWNDFQEARKLRSAAKQLNMALPHLMYKNQEEINELKQSNQLWAQQINFIPSGARLTA